MYRSQCCRASERGCGADGGLCMHAATTAVPLDQKIN